MSLSKSFRPSFTHAVRRLGRERGFTATVLLTLALCIGANVAMFAVIDAILLRALPFKHGDQLVMVMNSYPGAGAPRIGASVPNYFERREGMESFASVSIRQGGSAIIGEEGKPVRVPRDRVTPEFFDTLGTRLAMGQSFADEQLLYENSSVVILTHAFWQDYFDGDPEVLDREIVVDQVPHRVVGVLEPGFRFINSRPRFFVPLASSLEERGSDRRHSNGVQMIARLAEGVTVAAAQDEMNRVNEAMLEKDPYAEMVRNAGFETIVADLRGEVVRDAKPILLILQTGAILLLAIGCVNLANLLLIRAKGKAKETAVRQALGAGRRHMARESLLETMLLAVGGGLLGLGVGFAGIRLFATLGSNQLPLGANIVLDGRVMLVSLLGSAVVGAALAIPIVIMNARRDLAPALQSESRTGTVSKGAQLARNAFMVVQIGLAFALLAGAGLLGLSLNKALQQSPGFRAEQVLTASLSLPWKSYPESEDRLKFVNRLIAELRVQPGVEHAGFTGMLPFGGNTSNNATVVEGYEVQPGDSIRAHYTGLAVGEYWQAVGIPLVEGRYLEDADREEGVSVCLVDTAFAERYWPGDTAIGKRIATSVEFNEESAMTIVGVVGTIKQTDMTEQAPQGTIYVPYPLQANRFFHVAISSELAPEAVSRILRDTVGKVDPELPVDDIRALQARIDDSLLTRRSPAVLAAVFAGVALLLAAVGTYGVLAFAVGERRREIGVRVAIGARPEQVRRQFLWLGGRLLMAGAAIGVALSWLFGYMMKSVLFEVVPFHLGIVAAAALVMAAIVLLASYLPARAAARVSPMVAMGDE